MKYKILSVFVIAALFQSCGNEEKEDVAQAVDKTAAVETVLSTEHIDNQYDVLISSYKVWNKGLLVKEIIHRDTVPALGEFSDTDESGKTVKGKKDYELYITVK